jgi:hypothetical protein
MLNIIYPRLGCGTFMVKIFSWKPEGGDVPSQTVVDFIATFIS